MSSPNTQDSNEKNTMQTAESVSHKSPEKQENKLNKEPIATTQQTSQTTNTQQTNATTSNLAPIAPVVIKQSSGGRTLGIFALVLSVLGLGASGFLFVQGQNILKNQDMAFNQKLDKAALGESNNAAVLQDSLRKQEELLRLVAQLSSEQKNNQEEIERANRAYQALLKGRVNWLVDEVEATLNLASQQLLLSGNVPVAVTVLENIESRLSRFENADLLPIKQAISNDLATLKSQPYLDVSGTSLRLDRLESAVAGLPFVVDNTLQTANPHQQTAPADDLHASWWANTWNKILFSLKNLVEVRRLNNGDAMLLAPDQIYFIRENLRLRLLDARSALMQHNGTVYQNDLNNVEATVKQYFDVNSPATQSWLKELNDLKTLDIRMISGDALKASLLAVRSYQDGVRLEHNFNASEEEDKRASDASMPSAPASAPATPLNEPSNQKGDKA